MNNELKIESFFNKTVIILFCLTFVTIFIGQIMGITSRNDPIEKKVLAKLPQMSLENKTLVSDLNAYFSDNFGFRNILLKQYLFLKINLFKSWSFIHIAANQGDWRTSKNPTNLLFNPSIFSLYTQDELNSWKNFLEREQKYVESQNIGYFLVIIPEKSILDSDIPDSTKQFSILKHYQFINYMKNNSSVRILDTIDALLKAKAENQFPIFYKTDGHWTNYGAYIAYLEVIKQMSNYYEGIQPYLKDDFDIQLEKYDIWLGESGYNYPAYPYRPDYGVKFTLKVTSKDKYQKSGAILTYGDSYLDIRKRICIPCVKEEFPGIEPLIPLLFVEPPAYKGEWDPNPDYWFAKDTLENQIPIIRQNIEDKATQDKFINYLLLLGLLPDRVGLNYFLRLHFNDVVSRYTVEKLSQPLVDEYKPLFVIREALDERIPHLFNRLNCLYESDPDFNRKIDDVVRCIGYN